MKHPWMKFYPQDWRGDAKLRRCSRAARSLWLDMLGLMHEATPYGHLVMDGKPLAADDLGVIFGDSSRTVRALLGELSAAGVYSVDDDGTVYSRRMVRDETTRQRRAAGGVRSLGNPNVPRPRGESKDTSKDILEDVHVGPPQIPETRSQKPERTTTPRSRAVVVISPDAEEVLTFYRACHPRKRPDDKARKAILRALREGYTVADLCDAITGNAQDRWATESGNQGLPYLLRDNAMIDKYQALSARDAQSMYDAVTGDLTPYGERMTRPDRVSA